MRSNELPQTGRADLPERLEQLLCQAMATKPEDRPQTAVALIRGLQMIEQELRLPLTTSVLPADQEPAVDRLDSPELDYDFLWGATTRSRHWNAGRDQNFDTVDDDPSLLFRVYVPSSRLYAAETERVLTLFRDWLGAVRSFGIRQGGYQTRAGRVYEFFRVEDSMGLDIPQEYGSFSQFMALCAADSSAAAAQLIQVGLDRLDASTFVSRYSREIRRLNIDLRQERERRVMAICHAVETDLLESDVNTETIPIRTMVESLIPDPSAGYQHMLGTDLRPTSAPITINISQQLVNAVESSVIQNMQGTLSLGREAKQLLELIDAYGGEAITALQTAVYELEDQDARPADRHTARKRLIDFLRQLGKNAQDVAVNVLEKYIEAKLGLLYREVYPSRRHCILPDLTGCPRDNDSADRIHVTPTWADSSVPADILDPHKFWSQKIVIAATITLHGS